MNSATASGAPAPPTLLRALGPLDATAIIVGGIIGSGIFASPSLIAREAGAPGLSMLVWLVAGMLALCGGLCYAELSAAIPETGGTYAFLRRAYPWPFIAFSFGWTFFFVDGPGAVAAVATVMVSYLAYFFPMFSPDHPGLGRALAATVIVVLTVVNVLGVRAGGSVQRALTVLKLMALLAIIALAFGASNAAGALTPMLPPASSAMDAFRRLATALVPALFAFGGWTYTSYVAGEMKHPERNVPLSIVVGVLVVLAIYAGMNAALFQLLPFNTVQRSSHVASDAMQVVMGPKGAAVVAIAVIVSTLGALNAVVLSYSRIAWAMARDGYFFQALARVHPQFRSPVNAIAVQGLVACGFAVSGSFNDILGYFSFIEYVFFSLGVASLMVLRVREPLLARPVRTWLYPLPPLLFLSVSILYVSNLLVTRFAGSMVGVALLLLGVPFYRYWKRNRRANTESHETRGLGLRNSASAVAVLLAFAMNVGNAQQTGEQVQRLPADTTATLAFVDVTTLPMTSDSLLAHQTVIVRNGRIAQVGRAGSIRITRDMVRIDGKNRWLMPGLADMHTHLRYRDDLLLYAAAGVTTVLNLGQPMDNPLLIFKKEVEQGTLLGATIYASGIRVDGTQGRAFNAATPYLVRTPEEAIAEVRRQHEAGFQFIKAYSWLPRDAYLATIAEARKFGMPVVGHVPHSVGVLGVTRSGQRMIAHAEEYLIGPGDAALDSLGQPSTAVRREYDVSRIPEMVRATRDARMAVCATLSTTENIASQWGRPLARDSLLSQAAVRFARPEWQRSWRGDPRYIGQTTSFEPRLSFQRTMIRQLYEAGVPLLLGTDSPTNPVMPPGTSLYQELAAVVRAGVSPLGALRAGTRNASDFITAELPGSPAFGAIERGRVADLILLDANPLASVDNISRQAGVVVHGRWLSSARVRELVEQQARGYTP